MSDTAAHLVDHVFPHVPVRQWVLTRPIPLRYRVGFDHALSGAILSLFLETVFRWLRRQAEAEGILDGRAGAVTIIQRAGGSLNANIHYHALVLDGVFSRPAPEAGPVFRATPAPTDADVAGILAAVHRRIVRLLRRRGLLSAERAGAVPDPFMDEAPVLASCYAASVQGRVALGPHAGHDVSRLDADSPAGSAEATPPRCARLDGYSLHADVRICAHDRSRLERLCRDIARPPLALERLSELPDGRLRYALRRPWADGISSLLFEPLELLEKLAALVPRPRGHLVRFHGVLAPNAAWRPELVPRPTPPSPGPAEAPSPPQRTAPGARPAYALPWASLLSRVFALDVLTCPRCGGSRRLIAVLTDPRVVRAILVHLGLPPDPPPRAPARPPPQPPLGFEPR